MKKYLFLVGLLLCPLASALAQLPESILESLFSQIPVAKTDSSKIGSTDSAGVGSLGSSNPTGADSLGASATAENDSIVMAMAAKTLKNITISAPRRIYSMDGEVVCYNVAEDETAKGLTALDALQNAPSVEVDIDGNIKLRGSPNVEVWINGYPSHIDGNALQAYLETLPADCIDHIEVIKNPSAKYMVAEGCHIINIVTSAKLRQSHFLATGLGGSNEPSLRPWASYVFKDERLTANAYLGYSYSHRHSVGNSINTMRHDDGLGGYDTTAMVVESSESENERNLWNAFLNLDYKVDSANSLNLFHFSMLLPTHSASSALTDRTDVWPNARHYTYLNSRCSDALDGNSNTNLSWKHKFDSQGHNLSVTVNHFLFAMGSLYDLQRDYSLLAGSLPEGLQDFGKRTLNSSLSQRLSLSSRYNRPLGSRDELSLNASLDRQWSSMESRPAFFDTLSQDYALADSLRSRQMWDNGWSGSAGASWRHTWEAVTLTLGLRGTVQQKSYRIVGLFPDDSSYVYAYLSPSLNLTYRTPKLHYFRFNYALSNDNPGVNDLSTSRRYSEDGYSVGNPELKSGLTHDVNLSWNKFFQSHGSLEINSYAKLSQNSISACEEITLTEDPYLGRIVSYSIPYNVGSSYSIGIESNATYRATAWLNFRLYANLYRSGYEIDHPVSGPSRSDMTSYSLRLNCWAKIAKKVRVNLSGDYGTPTLSLFAQRQSSYSINLGASSDFWNNRISARINVSDLFNWNKSQQWSTNPYLLGYSSEHRDSRFVSASVSIKLGKMELEYRARTGEAN